MNAALLNQALETVPNVNVLINLVSQRVRQLNSSGGSHRPLIAGLDHLCSTDIALHEIIEGKLAFEMPECLPLERWTKTGHGRPQGWARI